MKYELIQKKEDYIEIVPKNEVDKKLNSIIKKNQEVRDMIKKNHGLDPRVYDPNMSIAKRTKLHYLKERAARDQKTKLVGVQINPLFGREYALGAVLKSQNTSDELYTEYKNGLVLIEKKPRKIDLLFKKF